MLVEERYYDPEVGLFITRDTELSQPAYQYCNDDPVNAVDPSGHVTIDIPPTFGDVIGGAAGALGAGGTLMGLIGELTGSKTLAGGGWALTGFSLVLQGGGAIVAGATGAPLIAAVVIVGFGVYAIGYGLNEMNPPLPYPPGGCYGNGGSPPCHDPGIPPGSGGEDLPPWFPPYSNGYN